MTKEKKTEIINKAKIIVPIAIWAAGMVGLGVSIYKLGKFVGGNEALLNLADDFAKNKLDPVVHFVSTSTGSKVVMTGAEICTHADVTAAVPMLNAIPNGVIENEEQLVKNVAAICNVV